MQQLRDLKRMSDLTFGTDELVPMVQADDWDDPRHIRGTDNTHTQKLSSGFRLSYGPTVGQGVAHR